MDIKEVIGIDASKLTLDCCIHGSGLQKIFSNNSKGIGQLADWALSNSCFEKKQVLFVFEDTGLYTFELISFLNDGNYYMFVGSGLEIKRSLGIARGKDDKADAKRIAQYGYRIREEITPYHMPSKSLVTLKRLMSLRRKLVTHRAGYVANLKEQKRVLKDEEVLFAAQQAVIDAIAVQITGIEKEIERIIAQDPELERLQKLLTGITGIGKVTARFLIVYTVGFTAFENWRKFASYVGIAPFPNRSGTSIKGRNKVSNLANKEGKALLHMCATCAIRCNPEMKAYYKKRLDKGKHKMSTLNIIRNKLLARAFAVAGRVTPYVDTMKYAS